MTELRDIAARHGATDQDYILVSTFGVGDTYLIAALCAAFREKFCRRTGQRLILIVPEEHRDLAGMFSGALDALHTMPTAHLRALNQRTPRTLTHPKPGEAFLPHPSFVPVRSDYPFDRGNISGSPPAHGRMHDAAMFAMILGLSPDTQLSLPVIPEHERGAAQELADLYDVVPGATVVLIEDANSWTAPPKILWQKLYDRLNWTVLKNDPGSMPLHCLLPFLEICGWVIGANCGLMQTIVLSRTKCRKTVITSSPWLGTVNSHDSTTSIPGTCVYGYRKTDGNLYDIEEFRHVEGDEERLAGLIAIGRMATGPVPDPSPISVVEAPTTPGDVIDRLTILQIKREKLSDRAHLMYRDVAPLCEIRDGLVRECREVVELESYLRHLNEVAWNSNQILIDEFEDQSFGCPDWKMNGDAERAEKVIQAFASAHRSNQERVRVKNQINAMYRSGREEKSYET